MAGAYTLYVNLLASTGGLSSGLRQGAAQLRAFDGQLDGTATRLNQVRVASDNLARAQAAASAQMVRSQGQVAQAVQRTTAVQERARLAQAVAATTARRAAADQAAVTAAAERAARAQALAQTMTARAQAAVGAGAAAAARTAAAAQTAAARATQEHANAQRRATAAQTTATRAATLAASADARAISAVRMRDEAQATAARSAQRQAQQVARAEGQLAAARNAHAARAAQNGLLIGAALGVGVAQAIALERAMANVLTISRQITSENVSAFTDQIVELSTRLPQTAEQLAEGLYQVVSSGFDGADAMEILEVAAQGAAAGLTTSETSARALLGVLNAYGMTAADASDVMDVMFQTVNYGVISFEELAQQLGDVVPMAAAAGVEFDDMSAALAAITLTGIPAAEAVTALNMLLTRVMKPTQDLKQAIKDLGYESAASAVEQDGLYVVVNKINGAAGNTAEGIANMWKDIRATRAALSLASAGGQNYANTYAGIANEVARAEATQKAYALQTDTVTGQWQLAANQARALAIDLGRALLPALKAIGTAVHTFVGTIEDLPGPMKSVLAIVAASVAALLLLRGAYMKVSAQVAVFRTALAAAQAGGAVMPAVLAGTSLAATGLAAVLTLGIAGYAAYTASKQKAKDATNELVQALQQEREEAATGVGINKLYDQLTSDGALKDLEKVGISTTEAIDAITSGGAKLAALQARLQQDSLEYAGKAKAGEAPGDYESITKFSQAKKTLEERHKMWSDAVKKEAEIAEQKAIVEAKIKQQAKTSGGIFDLFSLANIDRTGAPQITDEMKALAEAVGDAVDPSRAFKDAQNDAAEAMRKAGKDADTAKVKLSDYMAELRKQLQAQRDFQSNLSELAVFGYDDLADHFAELGVDAAPMLDELVGQLKKGKTHVADQLRDIVTEDAERSTEAYRLGLQKTAEITEKYGKEIGRAWAKASERNDPAAFQKVTEQMAMVDLRKAVKKSVGDARGEFDRGLDLLAEVAKRKGKDAAGAFQDALLSGDTERAMSSLKSIWGADVPIDAPELSKVVAAFSKAGKDANAEWSGALDLIRQVAATKGTEAAAALTSALLSGDMAAVQAQLEAIGLSVQNIPGTKSITVNVTANQPPPVVVPLFFKRQATSWDRDANGVPDSIQAPSRQANGSVLEFYASGGVRENHVAQIARQGTWRVWAEEAAGPEAYIPLAHNKRSRSRAITEEVVRRLGGKGVEWYADGGLTDFSHNPSASTELISISSIRSDSIRTVKKGKKETEVFDLKLFEKNLDKAVKRAQRWRKDLTTVARRAGQDVADALEAMGEDGVELTHKMATGSSKYVKEMTKDLEKLGVVVRVTLSDYTAQLKQAVKDQAVFEKNLSKLAAMGYGDLAKMLAEQGDEDAEDVAAEAAKSPGKAKKANTQAKSASKAIPDEDLPDLVTIISAVTSSKVGIHDVAEKTQFDEDRIIEVATLGRTRIKDALGKKATRFLTDLDKANKHLAYENGGIRAGLYATSNGIIRFAEPSTGGEAYLPLGQSKRRSATAVLSEVADRFGYQLSPLGDSGLIRLVDARPAPVQVVVVREERPAALVGSMPVTVNGGADAKVADRVGTEIMRRLRNAQRGGRI
ncbi:phage tail tape measure protein [Streptomyces ipomoeae]|uniref:phage tail tape measure protein n=1 Tax=Streptomyces ipomoeae TaxID=103232 RepID=UPI0029A96A3E|nr:phage tail tape measure protein [Streptomyces ipomoeae]MDX2824197.1 phage tail tape measure protein [Streptomyces ipomoeae]MDX2876823.1 phage tail tape measure protein [Streptomyces ipomoeae]